jgi:hypothetical protein
LLPCPGLPMRSNPTWKSVRWSRSLQDGDAALVLKSSSHPSVPGTLREVHLGEEMPRRLTVEREHTA